EERLDGRDDDGDGEIDEDLALPSQQMLAADYVDDRREAVQYLYPGGQVHAPVAVSVHEEVYGWSTPGYDGFAGLDFTITNHGDRTLRQVYVGLFVDLDSRGLDDPAGHTTDLVDHIRVARTCDLGNAPTITILRGTPDSPTYHCMKQVSQTIPVVRDSRAPIPAAAVLGLAPTLHPLETVR